MPWTKHSIRVNTIHPTGVNTPMVANAEAYKNPMPVELIEAIDISNAPAFLASDEARYTNRREE